MTIHPADRERASSLLKCADGPGCRKCAHVRSLILKGEADHHPLVQGTAFYRKERA